MQILLSHYYISYSCIALKRTLRDNDIVYFYRKISRGFHKKTMKQSYLEEPGLQTVDVVDPIHQLDNLLRGDLKYSRWQLIFCGQVIVFTHDCAESEIYVLSLASSNKFSPNEIITSYYNEYWLKYKYKVLCLNVQ